MPDDLPPDEPTAETPRPGWVGEATTLLKLLLSEASITLIAIIAIIGVQYWNQYHYLDQISRDLGAMNITLGTISTELDSIGGQVRDHEAWIQLGRVHVQCIEGQVNTHNDHLDLPTPPCASRVADIIDRPVVR